ncbi:MAG: hypothetical protein E6P95_01900 [Candidatus Moraniibacteriota bacterium]|nr:MAG: hypothetical protein E6P95_01900 [Candidatus Moranbacteria bacterium]
MTLTVKVEKLERSQIPVTIGPIQGEGVGAVVISESYGAMNAELVEYWIKVAKDEYINRSDRDVFVRLLGCLECRLRKDENESSPDAFKMVPGRNGTIYLSAVCPVLSMIARGIISGEKDQSIAIQVIDKKAACMNKHNSYI